MLDFEDRGVGRGLLYSSSSSSMSSNFVDVPRIPARKQIGTLISDEVLTLFYYPIKLAKASASTYALLHKILLE